MKREILVGSLALLFGAIFAEAVDLTGIPFCEQSQNGLRTYGDSELLVRFANVEPGSQPAEGPVILGLAVVRLPENSSLLDSLIRFNSSANVRYAEPNYKYRLLLIPNDPNFVDLWGMDNIGQTGGLEDADIDAPEGWDFTTGDPNIIVAVADTGIDYNHPDLSANMWVNAAEANGVPGEDDDGNGYVDDIYGYDFAGADSTDPNDGDGDPLDFFFHGTHVAGTIGAVGDNEIGVVGVCWRVKLMSLKIFADDSIMAPAALASDAVAAIEYAVANGARIINASWGSYEYSQALYDAIGQAGEAGVLFVAAAGNDYGNDNDQIPFYPASYDHDNIISVMATNEFDQASVFSNYGPVSVDVGEPGTGILSTLPTYVTDPILLFELSLDYGYLSGTSMAAPHVSGTCALVWSRHPWLPAHIVKMLLLNSVDPVLSDPKLCSSGGRVNVYNLLSMIPEGKRGKVLNTRDDPNDPNNLYDSIQAAIDDANDGDELIADANSLFLENIDFKGKTIVLRSGDVSNPNDTTVSPESTYILGIIDDTPVVRFGSAEGPGTVLNGFTISWGSSDYGGGISCEGASPTIANCIIKNNTAEYYGGGIDCYLSSPTIRRCVIKGNKTTASTGIGGGINCEQGSPTISECLISYNFAANVGGGIGCYKASPQIYSCVVANNWATYLSGGIDLDQSSPKITNCTIVVDDPNVPKSGGIGAYEGSTPLIRNCILWGNGDDLYNCSATYSCIEDGDLGEGNISEYPLFVRGPLCGYYLSQTAAGQLADSPCVDAGDPGLEVPMWIRMLSLTTRTDGVRDSNVVDIGAHFADLPAKMIELKVTVVDANGTPVDVNDPNAIHGYVDPNAGLFRQFEVVKLRAYPDEGYRVLAWTGTDDDTSRDVNNMITMIEDANVTISFEETPLRLLRTSVLGGHGGILPDHRRGEYYPDGAVVTVTALPDTGYIVDRWVGTDDDNSWATTNTVTMDSDKEVTVSFRQPKTLHVPGQYGQYYFNDIQEAIEVAYDHGDKIIVAAGTYSGGYDFMGKAITIASEHPDDPCTVAATIIQVPGEGIPAFTFQNGEGRESVVDGFTIIGSGDPSTRG